MIITLPESLEARLTALPQVYERVLSAVMFAELSSKQNEQWRASAFLRAALADYCSIEEMQKLDKPSSTHLKFANLNNPLLHLLKLMRHLSIHVKAVQSVEHSVPVTYADHAFDLNVVAISNLNAMDLIALNNGKHYNQNDIEKAVAWFHEAQLHWGAGYIVRIGTESLATLICSHYGI